MDKDRVDFFYNSLKRLFAENQELILVYDRLELRFRCFAYLILIRYFNWPLKDGSNYLYQDRNHRLNMEFHPLRVFRLKLRGSSMSVESLLFYVPQRTLLCKGRDLNYWFFVWLFTYCWNLIYRESIVWFDDLYWSNYFSTRVQSWFLFND